MMKKRNMILFLLHGRKKLAVGIKTGLVRKNPELRISVFPVPVRSCFIVLHKTIYKHWWESKLTHHLIM